jgi:G3E family GTPase
MIPEEILHKHWAKWVTKIFGDMDISKQSFNENFEHQFVLDAMQEYAQLQNKELQEQYSIMDGRRERAIKSLEESEKQFGEQQQEVERLKGLIADNYKDWFVVFYRNTSQMTAREIGDYHKEEWDKFKSENNL